MRELDPPVDVGGTVPAGRFLLLAPRPASQRERRGVWNLQGQAPPRGRRRRHSWSALRSEHASPAASFRFLLFQLQARRRRRRRVVSTRRATHREAAGPATSRSSRHPPVNELARAACRMSRGTLSQLLFSFSFSSRQHQIEC